MVQGIDLVPLKCIRCGTPLPAEPGEVAWVCGICGQGLRLDVAYGLRPLEVNFARVAQEAGFQWLPFWVARGQVTFSERETYGRDRRADELWQQRQTFILPAFECSLEEAGAWGVRFLRHPLRLDVGTGGVLEQVTIGPDEAYTLAEFVVLTVEAERRDRLKRVAFRLELEGPALWALPFIQTGAERKLALQG